MGDWRLEVVRMALYLTIPVGTFYYLNTPQMLDWVHDEFVAEQKHWAEVNKRLDEYDAKMGKEKHPLAKKLE